MTMLELFTRITQKAEEAMFPLISIPTLIIQ